MKDYEVIKMEKTKKNYRRNVQGNYGSAGSKGKRRNG